jgi:hypothetical protein
MDSNDRSHHQDREMKTVPIGKPAEFIKLVMQQSYQNEYNLYGQVGIVGLRVFGAANNETVARNDDRNNLRPALKFALPAPLPSSLPPQVKNELDPKVQQSVTRLEAMKKERAAMEVSSFNWPSLFNVRSRTITNIS